MRWRCAILIVLLAPGLIGAAKRRSAVAIRFHAETNRSDNNVFVQAVQLQYPPRQGFIGKVPEISERDIAAIFPFKAADGTMGCAFQLDQHGTLTLDTMSIQNRGRSVVAFVNGRQVADMVIDQRVSDGIITIPRGITPAETEKLQKAFPAIGTTKAKKKS